MMLLIDIRSWVEASSVKKLGTSSELGGAAGIVSVVLYLPGLSFLISGDFGGFGVGVERVCWMKSRRRRRCKKMEG